MNWALTSFTNTGITLLLFGEYLADPLSKRLILLLGASGLDLLFIPLSFVSSHAMLLLTLFFGGICASCYDLVVNSIGGDYEGLTRATQWLSSMQDLVAMRCSWRSAQ